MRYPQWVLKCYPDPCHSGKVGEVKEKGKWRKEEGREWKGKGERERREGKY